MLPYFPNLHHFCISQEAQPPPPPNPTTTMQQQLDQQQQQQQHQYDHFFSGHGQFNSETLEAVLCRPPRGAAADPAVPAAAAAAAVLTAARNGGGGHGRARKRPFRTDRHSKIRTAQGVRDRRMRLSLDVARDFFALQDKLGFDKASRTVEWLLTQSKHAINRLTLPDSADAAAAPAFAAAPPPADQHSSAMAAAAASAAKEKGEASSSSTTNASSARARNRDHDGSSPVAPMDERGRRGVELDWTAAAAASTEQPMDGLEYYFQYYNHLEEIMSCDPTTTTDE